MSQPFSPNPKGLTRLANWATPPGGTVGMVAIVTTVADLADVNPDLSPVVVVLGRNTQDDMHGGIWAWRPPAGWSPDGYLIVQANPRGTWHKLITLIDNVVPI